MAELLKDNMEAERRRILTDSGMQAHFTNRQTRREIPNILSWLQCNASQHMQPEKMRELLAYQAMMVKPVVQMQGMTGRTRATESRGKRERTGPCYAWNEGRCSYSRCRYDHVCARCKGGHKKFQGREGDKRPRDQAPAK